MTKSFSISKHDLDSTNPLIVNQDDLTGFIVYRDSEGIKVYKNFCPHMGSSFTQSSCKKNELHCPWHGYTYELSGGKITSNPGIDNWIKHLVPEDSPYRKLRKLKLIPCDWEENTDTITIKVKSNETQV